MSVKFSLSLFDDDDLKRIEDMLARAMARAVVSALKVAARDGLLLRPDEPFYGKPEVRPEPAPVEAPEVAEPPPPPEPPPPEPRVPIFLKPAPDQPYPNGKAVEPPPLVRMAKTRKIYLSLYKTVASRPNGFISMNDAAEFLGEKKSGQISMWLQKGELDALIIAGEKPPTKGLPGKLMINKESLIARQQSMRRYKGKHSEIAA